MAKHTLPQEDGRNEKQDIGDGRAEQSPEDSASERVHIKRKAYRRELGALQVQMLKLQEWIYAERLRAVVILEGLGPAGKRATARHIADGLDGRFCQVVTLDPPRKRERGQWHFQRYVEHFPAAGKLTILDGSWYHLPAMERALGIAGEQEFDDFLKKCVEFERAITLSGIHLTKYWFGAADDEQDRRFRAHVEDLVKHKILRVPEPVPFEPIAVGQVREAVLRCTTGETAPWHAIAAGDKRQARLDCMAHLLSLVPEQEVELVG